jgi:hypothetical protein
MALCGERLRRHEVRANVNGRLGQTVGESDFDSGEAVRMLDTKEEIVSGESFCFG